MRDSACYFFWSLARAYSAEALAPFSLTLARHLVAVSLLDREISIRRAASAALQECVGRLGSFPHGIALVGKTDFFSVGRRRKAFLVCTPAVAIYEEYQLYILQYLCRTSILHWDSDLRQLAAEAVGEVVKIDPPKLAPLAKDLVASNCDSREVHLLHGTLLTLAHLAAVCAKDARPGSFQAQLACFELLERLHQPSLKTLAAGTVLAAACNLISTAASQATLASTRSNGTPAWRSLIIMTLARKEGYCHKAAAEAVKAVSSLCNCSDWTDVWISQWPRLSASQQQSHSMALGAIELFDGHCTRARAQECTHKTLKFLLGLVERGKPSWSSNVETRRNAYESMTAVFIRSQIWSDGDDDEPVHSVDAPSSAPQQRLVQTIALCLITGLEDYTTDQRGDVGSWIRLACMRSLGDLVACFHERAARDARTANLSDGLLLQVVSAIARLLCERIDGVRQEAARTFLQMYRRIDEPAETNLQSVAALPSGRLVHEIFFSAVKRPVFPGPARQSATPNKEPLLPTNADLRSPNWLFPRAVRLLAVPALRASLLRGLVQTIGSHTELSLRVAGPSLVDFILANSDDDAEVNVPRAERYGPEDILDDLSERAEASFASSKETVPLLTTPSVLLEGGVLDVLSDPPKPTKESVAYIAHHTSKPKSAAAAAAPHRTAWLSRCLRLCARSLDKIEAPTRLLATMRLACDLLAVQDERVRCRVLLVLPFFLGHDLPMVSCEGSCGHAAQAP